MPTSATELEEYYNYKIPNNTLEQPNTEYYDHSISYCMQSISLTGDFSILGEEFIWVDSVYLNIYDPFISNSTYDDLMAIGGLARGVAIGEVDGNRIQVDVSIDVYFAKMGFLDGFLDEPIYVLYIKLDPDSNTLTPIAHYPQTNLISTPFTLNPYTNMFSVTDTDFYDDPKAVEFINYFFEPEASGDSIVVDTDLVSHYTNKASNLLSIIDLYFYQLSSKGPLVTVIIIFVSFLILYGASYFIISIIRRRYL